MPWDRVHLRRASGHASTGDDEMVSSAPAPAGRRRRRLSALVLGVVAACVLVPLSTAAARTTRAVSDAAGGNPRSPGELIYSLNAAANDEALCQSGTGAVLTPVEYGGSAVQFACNQPSGGAVATWEPLGSLAPDFAYGGYFGYTARAPAAIRINNVSGTINVITSQPATYGGSGWFGETYANGRPATSLTSLAVSQWGLQTTNFTDHVGGSNWSFVMTCGDTSTCTGNVQDFGARVLTMTASETARPQLGVSLPALARTGWIRNSPSRPWIVGERATDPSGVCALTVTAGGRQLLATGGSSTQKPSQWMVCNNAAANLSLDTNDFPAGPIALTTSATNGAYLSSATTETVDADDEVPTVRLSGRTRAASTKGTQQVVASAAAGPSGVAGISCSVGGGASVWYPASTATIPVSGIGAHQTTCFAVNNARDQDGSPGVSAPRTFTTDIGVPTALVLSPHKSVPVKICHRVVKKIHVPGHHAHARGGVMRAAVTIKKTVRVCKIKMRREKVAVYKMVIRHGHKHRKRVGWRRVRRPALRSVPKTKIWTRHGKPRQLSGVLTTTTGTPLSGATIAVQTAANNGRRRFHTALHAKTNASGVWKATLPAGPSRLVRAVYHNTVTTNGSSSEMLKLFVPARIHLRVRPGHTTWGHAVRLHGKLLGGYLPPGGEVVRLRIGRGSARETFGLVHVKPGSYGHFTATYRFGPGGVRRRFWFSAKTVSQSNYPWAAATSPRVNVTVR